MAFDPQDAMRQVREDIAADQRTRDRDLYIAHELDPAEHGLTVETIGVQAPHRRGDFYGSNTAFGEDHVEVLTTIGGDILVSLVTRLHDNREARHGFLRLPRKCAGLLSDALLRATVATAPSFEPSSAPKQQEGRPHEEDGLHLQPRRTAFRGAL